jgi:hypothetical protein
LELSVTLPPAKSQDIHRHPNGCVDVDFYRTRAIALRGQAKRDAATLKAAGAIVLAMAGAFAIVILIAAVPMLAPSGHSAVALSRVAPIR